MVLKVKDRVTIIDAIGSPLAEGTIVNANDLREPSAEYAVKVDGYDKDLLFFGKDRLIKQEEE